MAEYSRVNEEGCTGPNRADVISARLGEYAVLVEEECAASGRNPCEIIDFTDLLRPGSDFASKAKRLAENHGISWLDCQTEMSQFLAHIVVAANAIRGSKRGRGETSSQQDETIKQVVERTRRKTDSIPQQD
jgi:hypothetical protein